ncbi:MAG: hypothetical protein BM485_06445 [Desulfobulbaceae bacterium DB1]|nr:MAG: hypothetical protein BM485_06445 [Desulfobulbaceae bacterium DB1]
MEILKKNNLKGNNSSFPGRKKFIVVVVCGFLLPALLSGGIYLLLHANEMRRQRADLQYRASVVTGNLEHVLEHCLHTFRFLEGWRGVTDHFGSLHFNDFLRPFLARNCFLDGLAWAPRVPGPEREGFEQRLRREAFPGDQIKELDKTGNFRRAGERAEYFPVFFLTPYTGREAAVGFDLASEPVRREALAKARETGKIVASGAIRHVLERGDQRAFLLFSPLYLDENPADGKPQAERIEGFFLGVFRAGDLLAHVLNKATHSDLSIFLYDVTDPGRPRLLASDRCGHCPADVPPDPSLDFFRDRMRISHEIEVGTRTWRVMYLPCGNFMAARQSLFVWLVPGGVFLFGSLLVGHVVLLRGKNDRIATHVAALTRTEKDLRCLQEELQRIFDSAPFFLASLDKDMRVLRLNRAMERLVGLDSETARGGYCYDLWGQYADDGARKGKERICDVCKARDALIDGENHTYLRLLPGDRFIEVVTAPVRDEQGEIIGALEVGYDVSERERTARALRESEANYRTLFENSPCVIAVADFSGIKDYLGVLPGKAVADYEGFFRENPGEINACLSRLAISEVNQAALQMFGAAARQEMIDGLSLIIGPKTPAMTVAALAAIGGGHTSFEQEIILNHLSGTELYGIMRWNVVPGFEENYQRVIISYNDITARKLAESRLAQKKTRLRHLSRRLVEMEEDNRKQIARELHDKLGQQLTALNINLSILEKSGLLAPDSSLATRLSDSITLLEEMTGQVRDIMAELRPPILDDYGLGAALRWYGELFSRRTGIDVKVFVQDLPRFPIVMEMALFRVAQESLTNVAKYSEAKEVEIHCHVAGKILLLEITDNGRGVVASDVDENNGGGMGIISMRERMKAVGGSLRFDSRPGRGVSVLAEVKL